MRPQFISKMFMWMAAQKLLVWSVLMRTMCISITYLTISEVIHVPHDIRFYDFYNLYITLLCFISLTLISSAIITIGHLIIYAPLE